MIRRPPRSTLRWSSAASDVYKRQVPRSPMVCFVVFPPRPLPSVVGCLGSLSPWLHSSLSALFLSLVLSVSIALGPASCPYSSFLPRCRAACPRFFVRLQPAPLPSLLVCVLLFPLSAASLPLSLLLVSPPPSGSLSFSGRPVPCLVPSHYTHTRPPAPVQLAAALLFSLPTVLCPAPHLWWPPPLPSSPSLQEPGDGRSLSCQTRTSACRGLAPAGNSAPGSCLLAPPSVGWGRELEG